jgi:tetratricopeptide (TPR) repeat protein
MGNGTWREGRGVVTVVRITEVPGGADGAFAARVGFGDGAEYEVTVTPPGDASGERLLAWYFEEHLRFPFLDRDKERQAVAGLRQYGESLFWQVLGGAAAHDYRRLRERSFDGCRLEVTGSAGFQLLHWESLRDPELEEPLSVRLPVTRRVALLPSKFELPPDQPTLNILLVTARPFGRRDVGYRTISRPLLDALQQASIPVTVDLVRPGTWQALRDHLRETRTRHGGSGWYQVAHFDLHGGFNEYRELDRLRSAGQLLFAGPRVEQFEGRRPFLFFETNEEGKGVAVPAASVASLLAEHRVPVAVLNACQSAMQEGSEASLAQQLVAAGVPAAVGMAYSVTVTAAALAMPVLYGRLTQGADPVTALHAARQALRDDPVRNAYYDQDLDLEDWVLPVGFSQQPVPLRLRPMNEAEEAAFYQRQADTGDEPVTEYGFVGRDLDIQAVERRLLTVGDGNELLVQGMAGAGKSTFLRHLGWWWQRTGLVQQVFRFSWEDRAWTAAQIIREIRSRLLSPVEQARADLMPAAAQLEQAAGLLRASRNLLILDNAESITATPAAIPHAIDPAEQAQLHTLLARLRGGKTLVLIGSREAEDWLAPGTFAANVYPLPGLDPQAASTLTDRILRRHHAQRWLDDEAERQALADLTRLLGGYPLPMTVVLPALATASPSQVLADLKAGGSSADPAQKIIAAIEYSHGRLDPALQEALLLLAPFTSVIPSSQVLADYRSALLENGSAGISGEPDLDSAVAEAVRVGLASPHPVLGDWVQVQPVFPYFLRTRLGDRPGLREAVDRAHYQLYTYLGDELHGLLQAPGDPRARAAGQAATRAEYANLTAALAWGLRASEPINAIIRPLDRYLDETGQQTARRNLLEDAIAAYPEPSGKGQIDELALLHNLAGVAADTQHRLDDARQHHEAQLQLDQSTGNRRGQGSAYGGLGRIAYEQRRFAEARASFQEALQIFLEVKDRHSAASIHHLLGSISFEQRQFTEAEASYRQALDAYLQLGARYDASLTYHQLGMVAQEQRRFDEAEAAYRQSLDICLEFGDRHSAASSYAQLGTAALDQRRPDEAETAYRQALDIFLEFGDRHSTASIYHQLGRVAQEQGRFDEAETAYRQALDIKLEFGDRHSAASTYHQLGIIAQEQGRFDQAETAYRQALDIKLEFGDRHSAATTYHQLGRLAEEQQRFNQAEAAYRQAFDIYLETDRRQGSMSATRLGLLLAETGRHADAAAVLLDAALLWHQGTGDWDPGDLRNLRQERAAIGQAAFDQLVATKIPQDLQASLGAGVDSVADD